MKYYNTMVVFREVPDEITLAINITNCPCKCPSCHSKFLWGDTGTELDFKVINSLILANKGISCICFMGGDADPKYINELAKYVKENTTLKVAWYSGRDEISKDIDVKWFDFIKIGRYDDQYGPLDKETTNQRFYYIGKDSELIDRTNVFWRKKAYL